MATTPNLKIEIPDPSGVPSRENWVEKPLRSVDAKVHAAIVALSKRVKSGAETINSVEGTVVEKTIIFGTPFESTPRLSVIPSVQQPQVVQFGLGPVTNTQAVVRVHRTIGSGAVAFHWTATDLGNS